MQWIDIRFRYVVLCTDMTRTSSYLTAFFNHRSDETDVINTIRGCRAHWMNVNHLERCSNMPLQSVMVKYSDFYAGYLQEYRCLYIKEQGSFNEFDIELINLP